MSNFLKCAEDFEKTQKYKESLKDACILNLLRKNFAYHYDKHVIKKWVNYLINIFINVGFTLKPIVIVL